MRRVFSVVFVCGFMASVPAGATYVLPIGDVVVSQGDGFHPINAKTEVNAGDSVMAAPGGLAKIVYPDGCVIAVTPGSVAIVEDRDASEPQRECTRPSANLDPSFNVDATLLTPSGFGVIIATDVENLPPWPAGP
jgi:hypothetical protein